jgi:glutathione-independent formaldehyde dehydrogenase
VIYLGGQEVALKDIGYPKMEFPWSKEPCPSGVVLKVLLSCICGSDLHMVRGRTSGAEGLVLGHEITGEVIELGPSVVETKLGDIVSVPFNVACGTCLNCKARRTQACSKTNPPLEGIQGGIYGYTLSGGWQGGQAEYLFVPYADFNLLNLGAKEKAWPRLLDLALLSDIYPTGFHGCKEANVGVGSTVYIAGAGPVGLCSLVSCGVLGASVVFIGDHNQDRLKNAQALASGHPFGEMEVHTIDLNKMEMKDIKAKVKSVLGKEEVDAAIDCVGFEAHGAGHEVSKNVPTCAINTGIELIKATGAIGVPGVFLNSDPGAPDTSTARGKFSLDWGLAWTKGFTIATGQCPVGLYNDDLRKTIMHDRVNLHKGLNMKVVALEEAPMAYREFNKGAPHKYVIDPHNSLGLLSQEHRKTDRDPAKDFDVGVLVGQVAKLSLSGH